jgi:hypothetical protein
METADQGKASFAIVVGRLEVISRDKNNYKRDLNHSVFVTTLGYERHDPGILARFLAG